MKHKPDGMTTHPTGRLSERENMLYQARVEALQRGLARRPTCPMCYRSQPEVGKGPDREDICTEHKETGYHSNNDASQEKAALHMFQSVVGEDLQRKCADNFRY